MFVITVDFQIAPEHAGSFMENMLANAEASRRDEPGCRQFDVCRDPDDPGRVFLYEVYDDRDAFEAHNRSDHFRTFQSAVDGMVLSKAVRSFREVWQ